MNREEVTMLCRYVAAASPAQAFDEYTTDVWADILPAGFTLEECQAAVVRLKRRQTRIDVSDIVIEARRARRPAAEAAHLRAVLDPGVYRAQLEADDAATDAALARIEARLGRPVRLKAVPPPDYEGTG